MQNGKLGITPATESDRGIIANLIQLYLYDMAAQTPFEIGADGLYDYTLLDTVWQFPYLIYWEKQLVGFALILNHCPITGQSPFWFMAEYFVLRPYRGQAIGRLAFAEICARHPGQWHIGVQTQNTLADGFWQGAFYQTDVAEFDAHFDNANWRVRAFQVGGI